MPLACGHGVVLSAIRWTSTPRFLARTSASTIPEPVVRPYALTRISRSALSIGRMAKEAQSSSGAKQTAIAALDVIEAGGATSESAAKASGRATENPQKL